MANQLEQDIRVLKRQLQEFEVVWLSWTAPIVNL